MMERSQKANVFNEKLMRRRSGLTDEGLLVVEEDDDGIRLITRL